MLTATISWLAALTVWPAPLGPTCTIVLPTASKTGPASSKSAASPPTMIDEHRVLGARLTAGDRGVEEPEALLARLLGERDGDVGPDAGEVDDQGAGRGVLEDAALAGEHLLDVGGVGDHHGDHVGALDRLGDRGGGPAAGVDQRLGALG